MKHAKRPWQHLYDTGRWRKLRLAHLASEPLCRMCLEAGRVQAASVVDHITPHKGDEVAFFSGPFQSLCKPCHDRHKQSQDRTGRVKAVIGSDGWPVEMPRNDMREVSHPAWFSRVVVPLIIVCGPPASGKTTYVARNKEPHDLVLDLDTIALERYGKPAPLVTIDQRMICLGVRNRQLGNLMSKGTTTVPRAWLIVSEPTASWRQWWHDKLGPSAVVVMETPASECIERAKADTRQERPTDTPRRIADWWSAYEKRQGEVIITPSHATSA